ncbi:hypothetical protein SCYAM73S_08174 [Streptomyces cyaneofuscatus]
MTADTRAGGTDGSFGGSVSATSADGTVQVRSAVGVEREVESYSLTLRHTDEDGKATGDAVTSVADLYGSFYADYADEQDGELTVRLPEADYLLTGDHLDRLRRARRAGAAQADPGQGHDRRGRRPAGEAGGHHRAGPGGRQQRRLGHGRVRAGRGT